MEKSCETCGKRTIGLRLCTGCRSVYYCSVACQRTSWKNGHKDRCKSLRRITDSESSEIKTESKDEKTNTSDLPSNSLNEQEKTTSVINNNKEEATASTSKDNESCAVCGKKDGVKMCGRCKKSGYCSKTCQRFDWPKHRLNCCDQDVEGVINTTGFEKSQPQNPEPRKPRMFNRQMPSAFSYLFGGAFEQVDTETRAVPKPNSLGKAINLARESFPRHVILDEISEIPQEFWGHRPGNTGQVVVAFISRYHGFVGRHCVYIRDKDGEEIYIAFYFDDDNPYPYFHWSDVKPGKYICIRDPFIHFFADGSVGIRIDLPSNVKLIAL